MTCGQGVQESLCLFLEQLAQVSFNRLIIGWQNAVIPPLTQTEFGVTAGSMTAISASIVSNGVVRCADMLIKRHHLGAFWFERAMKDWLTRILNIENRNGGTPG
ncbi:hypothetical protein [Lutimaribacter saemankumensis]|uniref:Uncharacterized protein n=1 Tax=Lutimaribacter saemankumensis TaxID=490829 RepID=A0A1G8KAX1_9RHOB|nr:hypothetical protein [Lutimaribacter saemankumensis]SDI40578.1 hypothetical protein SAMN05421850_102474 [Lutimaribacter saemankumensis]